MSEAKKCDRCGNLYERYGGVPIEKGGIGYNQIKLLSDSYVSVFDLCEPCMTKLTDWVREGGRK